MENPATWGPAEKVVDRACARWWQAQMETVVGLSLSRTITDALREADLLSDVPLKTITDALREADLLSDVPLKLAYHVDHHDGEFYDDCKYCDWEREHNDNYPVRNWSEME